MFAATTPEVGVVAALVAAYNALPPEATFQDRFAALQRIDTEAYQVFQQNPAPELPSLPFGEELRALLHATDAAHAALVDEMRFRTQRGEEGNLPLDASALGDGEKAETAALWSSLARREGELGVEGSADFQKSTYGGIAKLMQHPLGRQLVGFLDRRTAPDASGHTPDRRVSIQESEHEPNAGARDVTSGDMNDVGPATQPSVDPRELTDAMLRGDRGTAMGGRQFAFGPGSAVDVQMPSTMRDTRSLDADKNEIVTPGFIALGHELGHAAKAKSGAKGSNVGFGPLPDGVRPGNWVNNSEEYLNVKGVENPLRAEHGMKQRGEYTDSVKSARVNGLMQRLVAAVELYPDHGMALASVAASCKNNRISEDAFYAELQARVDQVIAEAAQATQQGASSSSSSSVDDAERGRRRDRWKAQIKAIFKR